MFTPSIIPASSPPRQSQSFRHQTKLTQRPLLNTITEEEPPKHNDFGLNDISSSKGKDLQRKEALKWAAKFGNEHFLHVSTPNYELLTPYKLQRMNALPKMSKAPRKRNNSNTRQKNHFSQKQPKLLPRATTRAFHNELQHKQKNNHNSPLHRAPQACRRLVFSEASEESTPDKPSTPRRNNRSLSSLFGELSTAQPTNNTNDHRGPYLLSTPINQNQLSKDKNEPSTIIPTEKPDPPGKTALELTKSEEIDLPLAPQAQSETSATSLSSEQSSESATSQQCQHTPQQPKHFKVGTFLRHIRWPCRRSHK